MGKTSIEWTDASWNPVVGCTEVSPGCANCYAARLASSRLAHVPAYKGLATIQTAGSLRGQRHVRWNGEVRFLQERLEEPLHWRKPRRIFVCDMGDLFHESVTHDQIKLVFGTMVLARHHTYQILTKRADRLKAFLSHPDMAILHKWPLPNVWLGVSVENQAMANKRIPDLLSTPAAVRFVSAEPLLGPVDFAEPIRQWCLAHQLEERTTSMDWIIAGGESGPRARPMHPDWPRGIRDWCQHSVVHFFFKQWGEFAPIGTVQSDRTFSGTNMGDQLMLRYGKKLSGRLLDGREWNEFPA